MTDKTKMILWYVGLAALVALLSSVAYMRGHSTIAILVIIIPAALIANGFFAEFEDNAPGGFQAGIKPDCEAKERTIQRKGKNEGTQAAKIIGPLFWRPHNLQ